MKKNYKIYYIVAAVILLAAAIFLYLSLTRESRDEVRYAAVSPDFSSVPDVPAVADVPPEPEEEPVSEITPEPEPPPVPEEPYVSPVDFAELQKLNPDIYGWLNIPGTDISHALVQRPGDDDFYLTHNELGESDRDGALFTQAEYNSADFTDPVNIVYGHNMVNGEMFARLEEYYCSENAFENYGDIAVYLPDRELHFTAFAAMPYDNRHILYNYDFTDQRTFRLFFADIMTQRALNAHFADGAEVKYGDSVIILSTCITGDSSRRYLVLGAASRAIEN